MTLTILFYLMGFKLLHSLIITISSDTFRVASRTFGDGGGGGGGGGGKGILSAVGGLFGGGGGGESTPVYIPPPPPPAPVPTEDTEAVQAKKVEQEARRAKAAGLSSTDVTGGTLGGTTPATVSRPTLLGGA
jgi:hypothetical protein